MHLKTKHFGGLPFAEVTVLCGEKELKRGAQGIENHKMNGCSLLFTDLKKTLVHCLVHKLSTETHGILLRIIGGSILCIGGLRGV